MTKNNKMKLVEGGLIGAALGMAAGIVIMSEAGQKLGGDVKKKSAEFHAYLAPRFKKMKKVGEAEYNSFLKEAMKSYVKAKGLSVEEEKHLISHAKKSWKHIKKHSR